MSFLTGLTITKSCPNLNPITFPHYIRGLLIGSTFLELVLHLDLVGFKSIEVYIGSL